jgi:hypothetical protein
VHENYDREAPVEGSSDRSFGLVFAGFFAVVGGVQLWSQAEAWIWWFGVAGLFLAIAWLRPGLLAPLNRLWTRLGLLLFRVVNPIVMAILFYLVVVPVGLTMRLSGKDPMNRRHDSTARTYWISRDPPGPAPDTMKNQF